MKHRPGEAGGGGRRDDEGAGSIGGEDGVEVDDGEGGLMQFTAECLLQGASTAKGH